MERPMLPQDRSLPIFVYGLDHGDTYVAMTERKVRRRRALVRQAIGDARDSRYNPAGELTNEVREALADLRYWQARHREAPAADAYRAERRRADEAHLANEAAFIAAVIGAVIAEREAA
jgi:hypothetical protein